MPLPILTFDQAVKQQQSQMQASSLSFLDFSEGAVLPAFTESNAGNFLWLQSLSSAVYAANRLSTSKDQEVDTFIAQFSFYRYKGNASSGSVTFSRNTPTQAANIPIGTIVSVSNVNNLNFIVTTDTSNPYYSESTNSYVIPIDTSSASLPVTCQQSGILGNVLSGAIDTIDSQLIYVDFVTNSSDFTNGADPWTDEKTKQEFALYIQSLTRGTGPAIAFCVSTTPGPPLVQRFNIIENEDPDGTDHLGFFYAVVDDGTGVPNETLIDNVITVLEDYRGLTIAYDVIGPDVIEVDVSVSITLIDSPTDTEEEITEDITSALISYINSLSFNSLLPYTKIADVVYDSNDNILNVTSILLNGGTSDLTTNKKQLFFSDEIVVNYL